MLWLFERTRALSYLRYSVVTAHSASVAAVLCFFNGSFFCLSISNLICSNLKIYLAEWIRLEYEPWYNLNICFPAPSLSSASLSVSSFSFSHRTSHRRAAPFHCVDVFLFFDFRKVNRVRNLVSTLFSGDYFGVSSVLVSVVCVNRPHCSCSCCWVIFFQQIENISRKKHKRLLIRGVLVQFVIKRKRESKNACESKSIFGSCECSKIEKCQVVIEMFMCVRNSMKFLWFRNTRTHAFNLNLNHINNRIIYSKYLFRSLVRSRCIGFSFAMRCDAMCGIHSTFSSNSKYRNLELVTFDKTLLRSRTRNEKENKIKWMNRAMWRDVKQEMEWEKNARTNENQAEENKSYDIN